MINYATMFTGGLSGSCFALKYEDIKYKHILGCEIDKHARKQYIHFHGEPETFYEDVANFDATPYKGKIDLLIYGSSCQNFSLAGNRQGLEGDKSKYFRYAAIRHKEMMPKVFIFENVKGLLSSNNGNDYKEVIHTFTSMGYHCTMQVLNTKDYGIPQNRERVFIVGFLDHNKHLGFEFEQPTPLKLKLKDLLEDEVDKKYYLSDKIIKGMMGGKSVFKERFKPKDLSKDDYATCLDTREGGRRTNNFIKIKSATTKGYELATQEDSINFTHPDSKTRRGRVGKGVAQTLDCACNQGVIDLKQIGTISKTITKRANETPKEINEYLKSFKGNYTIKEISERTGIKKTTLEHYLRTDKSRALPSNEDWFNLKRVLKFGNEYDALLTETISKQSTFESTSRVYSDEVAPTLTCSDGSTHLVDYKIRKLTPTECFRLQGVKDEDIDLVVSNTQAYKIAGNAISVNVMQSILRSIYKNKAQNLFSL